MLRKLAVLLITLFLFQSKALSQDKPKKLPIDFLPVPDVRLPYNNPLEPSQQDATARKAIPILNTYQKRIIQRIADIYRIHVLALEAQVNNDALSAEKYINQALSSIQKLMDDYPGVQSDRRFAELYRTVMTEYQEFYGITKPVSEEEGDIFAIRDEMFSEDNDWFNENYFVLPENLSKTKTQVPLVINKQVKNHLAYLWIKHPEVMERWLQRAQVYVPMMKKIFKEVGVPTELVYLSMIESGLVPYARSRARAEGMWQFIKSTGEMYGLEVNWWIDERRDPEKATRAAARHLKDLYNIWGNWPLALANYNLGGARLKRAIRYAHGVENYWKIYPYLPRETRGYVPSYIATALICLHPKQFGFKTDYGEKPYSYDVVDIKGSVDLSILAKCAGVSTDSLKTLNPELLRWATPPGAQPYPLKIPTGDKQEFLANYSKVPASDRKQIFVHVVKRGETLGYIAHKYGTSVRALYASNKDLSRIIYPGERIMIPLPPGGGIKISADKPSLISGNTKYIAATRRSSNYARPSGSSLLYYTVKSGDTIGNIAEWYHTYAWKIRVWNHIGNLIRVGQRLRIYVPKSEKRRYEKINHMSFASKQATLSSHKNSNNVELVSSGKYVKYKVKRNDSLSDIANSFNTSIRKLKEINHLRSSRIYVGQVLLVKKND